MRTGASDELSQYLQEVSDNARFIEGYADHLLKGLRDLQSAATRARSLLDDDESADDIFKDNARELRQGQRHGAGLRERVGEPRRPGVGEP
jgi:hypothetical protein